MILRTLAALQDRRADTYWARKAARERQDRARQRKWRPLILAAVVAYMAVRRPR